MYKTLSLLFVLISIPVQAKLSITERQDLLLAELSTTREAINKQGLEWEEKFYEYLINDDDPNIQIIGHKENLKLLIIAEDKNAFIGVANKLNEMLDLESLSPKSLKNIKTICDYKETQPHCDHDLIFEKQFESTPDNAFIYLNSLYTATQDHNFNEVEMLINDMAESKYIDVYYYPDPGFREKIELYVKINPFSKNKLELEKLWIVRQSGDLTPEQDQVIFDKMEDYMVMLFININRMSSSIPSYLPLLEICSNNPKHEESCLKIAETFINHSKSVISKHMGHAIKIEILKQNNNNTEKLLIAEKSKLEHKNNLECVSEIMEYGYKSYFMNGPKYNVIAEPIERKLGEVAFYKSIAKQNYEYYSKLGDTKITSPDDCDKSSN